ncbi:MULTISPECIES: molybdopterin oxidoreductase family protein [unclassified Nitratiruptor]|uniref:molybdopterin oxidoreductase family protein n=1 Tax=unclassified Nitratiruptor TaxID=2624044 RepID=UPI001915F608|nr:MULTISPECIES: molybdopterin-dependent oxidoreductase [unclassified Nitratiruptor]BCD60855.1 formate dehydrogenase major subunit [Nitratiruptor sp. YY08-10]BCD64787.1 formate dehydrogenase major subunit [Nitratiruptor sp. YY08-14]
MDVISVCTYCGVGCDIAATIEDGRIVKVNADPQGVVSQGKLCIKGKYGWEYLYHPNRLRHAYIKKSFVQKNLDLFENVELTPFDSDFYTTSYKSAYSVVAKKLQSIIDRHSPYSFAAIGGARTSCESGYLFQKFAREVIKSPHVDNCARVCHSPSLKGMRATIGEGAATNPFDDIYKTQNILVIGSNTTEAHPIVANRILDVVKDGVDLSVIDVREIQLSKFAKNHCSIPFETNLLILNMIARIILENGWENREFIQKRCKNFEEYRALILNDEFADPSLFEHIRGYEDLPQKLTSIAYDLAHKKTLIFWGLGITEHLDGSYAVMAITHLAMLTGNIGKEGGGLMPLRGQNNVQGTCDMGMLPYYLPDYQKPQVEGLMTPDLIDAMLEGKIKALFNMGEDIAHIHPNQNKIKKALKNLELLVVNEIFFNEITKYADVVFGVKSAYEKEGVYVNAERRLHLSQPLIQCNLPDDWEVLVGIGKFFDQSFAYENPESIWNEVRKVAHRRFKGASYEKLAKNRLRGLQWPVFEEDTPILHKDTFRTKDGYGTFRYKQYELRGMMKELMQKKDPHFYLTTGRIIVHYNNAAQTKACEKLAKRHEEDILLVSEKDREFFEGKDRVVLESKYGRSHPLKIKFSKTIKRGTLYVSFHHAKSHINYLFGDEADTFVKTARFKSVKVKVL